MLIPRICIKALQCFEEPDLPCAFSSSWPTQKSQLHIPVAHQLQTSPSHNPCVLGANQRWSRETAVPASITIAMLIQADIWYLWKKSKDGITIYFFDISKPTELTPLHSYPPGHTGMVLNTSHTWSSGNSPLVKEKW